MHSHSRSMRDCCLQRIAAPHRRGVGASQHPGRPRRIVCRSHRIARRPRQASAQCHPRLARGMGGMRPQSTYPTGRHSVTIFGAFTASASLVCSQRRPDGHATRPCSPCHGRYSTGEPGQCDLLCPARCAATPSRPVSQRHSHLRDGQPLGARGPALRRVTHRSQLLSESRHRSGDDIFVIVGFTAGVAESDSGMIV